MATKSVTINKNEYTLVTDKMSYIHLKNAICLVEFHTGASAVPVDTDAVIIVGEDIAYPGGDALYMKLRRYPESDELKITVDELSA